MHHPGGVHRGERVREPAGHPGQGRRRERPALGDHLLQGPAGDVAGDDVGHVARQVGVDHLRDVGAAHPLHGLDLARQPAPCHGLLGRDRAEDLERDRPPAGVAGHVHDAHPALTDPSEQPVGPEPVRHLVLSSHGSPNRLGSVPEHRTVPSTTLLAPRRRMGSPR